MSPRNRLPCCWKTKTVRTGTLWRYSAVQYAATIEICALGNDRILTKLFEVNLLLFTQWNTTTVTR